MCNSCSCCDFHHPLTARFCCSPAFDRPYSRSRASGGVGGGGGGTDGGGNSRNSADITFSHYLATPFSVHLILLLCFRVGSLRIQTVVAGADFAAVPIISAIKLHRWRLHGAAWRSTAVVAVVATMLLLLVKKRAMVIQLLRCFLPSCYQLLLLTRSASAATSTAARSFRTFLPACVARDTRSNCSRDLSSRSDTCSLWLLPFSAIHCYYRRHPHGSPLVWLTAWVDWNPICASICPFISPLNDSPTEKLRRSGWQIYDSVQLTAESSKTSFWDRQMRAERVAEKNPRTAEIERQESIDRKADYWNQQFPERCSCRLRLGRIANPLYLIRPMAAVQWCRCLKQSHWRHS